ncbi:MAG: lipopolysaccharide heptosyltransferase II [Terriglobales bacterium]
MRVVNRVVLAPNWLGDAVMSLPALAALVAGTPDQNWTVLARPSVAPIYRMARLPVRVEPLAHRRLPRLEGPTREVVIFPNSFHSALLALRLRARRRIGYARDRRGWLLRPAFPPPAPGSLPGHESFYYLELLRLAGFIASLPPETPARLRVPLHPDAALLSQWRQTLVPSRSASGPQASIVALHAGSTFGSAKCWLTERFAELAGELARRGATVVLIGSAAERELARKVRMLAPHPAQIKNLVGETSLEDLVALLAVADLLVANDSGPMHVAGAVGTPVVALFGSTNEKETYPLTEDGKLNLIKAPGIACSPCKLRECPIDHRCMERISVRTVLAAVEDALSQPRRAARL